MIELSHHLVELITKRFPNTPVISVLMKNCLDASQFRHKVLLTNQQTMTDYGTLKLHKLIDYTGSISTEMMINESVLQEQHSQWKQHCLDGIHDEETFKTFPSKKRYLLKWRIFYFENRGNLLGEFLFCRRKFFIFTADFVPLPRTT